MPRWTDERLRAEIQKGVDDIAAGRFTRINNKEELIAFFDSLAGPDKDASLEAALGANNADLAEGRFVDAADLEELKAHFRDL